jgi:hypothetical protein
LTPASIGRITRDSRKLYQATGEILLSDGTVAVEASGKYMKLPISTIVDRDFADEWFVDQRVLPADIDI